jgi:hypothetical protein
MATATTKNQTEATTERIRDLNERILDAGKQAGGAYLDAYERTLESIADYQENVAKQTDVEWISTVVDAQARFTRELTKLAGGKRRHPASVIKVTPIIADKPRWL